MSAADTAASTPAAASRSTVDPRLLLLHDEASDCSDDDDCEWLDDSAAGLGEWLDDCDRDGRGSPDLYAVLGVARDATPAELRAAYKRLCLLLHPDKHSSAGDASADIAADAEAAFARVSAAYAVLNRPDTRAIYDTYGHEG